MDAERCVRVPQLDWVIAVSDAVDAPISIAGRHIRSTAEIRWGVGRMTDAGVVRAVWVNTLLETMGIRPSRQ